MGVPVGDPWVIGEPGTRQQKIAEKADEKQTILHQFFFNNQAINNQSTISQIKWIMQM